MKFNLGICKSNMLRKCNSNCEILQQSNNNNDNGDEDVNHLLKLDTAIIDNIQQTGTSCRCEELNSKAVSLENSETCALANQIIKEGDILAGDDEVVSDTCSSTGVQSCAEQVSTVVNGFIEYGCAVTNANNKFIYTLSDAKDTNKLESLQMHTTLFVRIVLLWKGLDSNAKFECDGLKSENVKF